MALALAAIFLYVLQASKAFVLSVFMLQSLLMTSIPVGFVFNKLLLKDLLTYLQLAPNPSYVLFTFSCDSDTSNEKSGMKMKSFSCWPLSLSSYGNHLIATSTDGQVTTWSVAVQNKIQVSSHKLMYVLLL